ncbi:Integrase [Gammaproteobacteria bacterium]
MTAERFQFTMRRLEAISPPPTGRIEVCDTTVRKLRLRVSPDGTKSFCIVTTYNGRMKRVSLGKFPEVTVDVARQKANEALTDLAKGTDPVEAKRVAKAESLTLGELLNRYLERQTLKDSTRQDYIKKLRTGFSDWIDIPASRITEAMVLKRHRELTDRGATQCNTTFRVLRAVCRHGVAIKALTADPVAVLSHARLWHPNHRRERVIPLDDLGDFLRGIRTLQLRDRVFVETGLLTGLRIDELLSLVWVDVDLGKKTLVARDTKNGRDHLLPVPEILIPIMQEYQTTASAHALVFANPETGKKMHYPAKLLDRAIAAGGVEFSWHDLRRTFASAGEAIGTPFPTLKRLMNHTSASDVTLGYVRHDLETLRGAMNRIATYIESRANMGQIVEFPNRKRA